MRKALILQLGALSYALTLVNCYAQLSMGITADKKIYLQYEPIELTITIENNSGNTLTFDKTDPKKPASSYIRCIVEGEDHERVKETGDAIKRFGKGNLNMAAGFILPAGGKRSLKVQVNRFYKMSQAQTYSIQVYVRHKRFGKDFISKPANVSIVNGVPVVSQRFGLPTSVTTNDGVIRERTCELISFVIGRNNFYALRISDKNYIYCTHRLARHTAADKPVVKIDARSHIHVLLHTHPKLYTYWIFDHDGAVKQNSLFRYVKHLPVPKLHKDPDIGRVIVLGGERYVPEEDEEIELPEYRLDNNE